MNIVLLCATQRGFRFLKQLHSLCTNDKLTVFSFRETPWEPKFLDDIQAFCCTNNLTFFATRNVFDKKYNDVWSVGIDLAFFVHWRYIVPVSALNYVRESVVFHDSLLPAYRGFSPTVWAMINGEQNCGASMFYIADEVDTGDIIDQEEVIIKPEETIIQVMDKVTEAYLNLLTNNIQALRTGQAPRKPQDHSRATYGCKRTPEDNLIDWQQATQIIYNLIRAVGFPYTGAYTFYKGTKVIVWSATPYFNIGKYVGVIPGKIIEVKPQEGVIVLTIDGALLVNIIQLEGNPKLCASEVIKSISDKLG